MVLNVSSDVTIQYKKHMKTTFQLGVYSDKNYRKKVLNYCTL